MSKATGQSTEERKRLLLAQVEEGAREFSVQRATAKGTASDAGFQASSEENLNPPTPDNYQPPNVPETFAFEEPAPRRQSLTAQGWRNATHLYRPKTLKAAKALADDLGIYFAELQDMALGLLIDPGARTSETEALLRRVRNRFSGE